MRKNLLYLASSEQLEAIARTLIKMQAQPVVDPNSVAKQSFEFNHRFLGDVDLRIDLIDDIDAVTPQLKYTTVDLLIYDERNGNARASQALKQLRDDVYKLSEKWGPEFLFPFSRVVAITSSQQNTHDLFELGRYNLRDVMVNPARTSQVILWIRRLLLSSSKTKSRTGVALSGGGIEGFLYQLGAIAAINAALGKRNLYNCDVVSGISSGSIAGTILAARIPTDEVMRSLQGDSEVFETLSGGRLYDIAAVEIGKRWLREGLNLDSINPTAWIRKSMRSIPTGFFKGDGLQSYIENALERSGAGKTFSDLKTELYIGATDQDNFEHVVFGLAPHDKLEISKAIRASCSLPPFFVPCVIDGRWYVDGQITKTCNLEFVIERNCKLCFIIDPMRPSISNDAGGNDQRGGVFNVIQTIKALVASRFDQTLRHVTEIYPNVDFLIFQPDEECAKLMSGSPMRYKIRTQIIELAYKGVLRKLRERHHVYKTTLDKNKFKLLPAETLLELENKGLNFDAEGKES